MENVTQLRRTFLLFPLFRIDFLNNSLYFSPKILKQFKTYLTISAISLSLLHAQFSLTQRYYRNNQITMEENGFNNHLSEENNQPANGDNILKEQRVVIFRTSDYDLSFNEREVKYKDYDHILCEECDQEIDKEYYYCNNCIAT